MKYWRSRFSPLNPTSAKPKPVGENIQTDNYQTIADCQYRFIWLFCCLSPIVGYSYTGRFKSLGIFLVSSLIIFLGANKMYPELDMNQRKTRIYTGLSISVVAALENSMVIFLARKAVQDATNDLQPKPFE